MKKNVLYFGCSLLVSLCSAADNTALLDKLSRGTASEKDEARLALLPRLQPADVSTLAGQLANSATFDNACFLLGALGTPEADDVLFAALKDADPARKVALLQALRRRGCGKALAFAIALCKEKTVACEEAQRYVATFTPDAASLLAAVPPSAASADALLRGGVRMEKGKPKDAAMIYLALQNSGLPENVRLAAYCGAIRCAGENVFPLLIQGLSLPSSLWYGTAARQTALQPPAFLSKHGVALLDAIPETGKIALLRQLAAEKTGVELIRAVARCEKSSQSMLVAATDGLGVVGNKNDVPRLLELLGATDEGISEAGRKALTQLSDREVNALLTGALDAQKTEQGKLVKLIRILAVRNAAAAPQMASLLSDNRVAVRGEALLALCDLATPSELEAVVNATLAASEGKELRNAEKTINALSKKFAPQMTDLLLRALAKAKGEKLTLILHALGVTGTENATLELVKRVHAGGEESDEALRVLTTGNGKTVLSALLASAAGYPKASLRILALRGALRLMANEKDDVVLTDAIAKAIPLVVRPEEKMLLTDIRDPRAKNATLAPVTFTIHRIGRCRTEACGVADFNGDGKPDIVAGPYLYTAPDWKVSKIRDVQTDVKEEGKDTGKGYARDFMNLPLDVNGNGKPDIISGDWFSQETWWFENALPHAGLWPKHVIEKTGNIETGILVDLDGDGHKTDFLPDTHVTCLYAPCKDKEDRARMIRDSVSDEKCTLGTGCGDLNGDGKNDILRALAWYEKTPQGWKRHPLNIGFHDGKLGHASNLIVYDVNKDGINDIIVSSAHKHGIFWFEQKKQHDKNGELVFEKHVIDDTWSQAHYLGWADIDNDGVPEIITGKRFLAHNGGDPDSSGKMCIFYYDFTPGSNPAFRKHIISFDDGVSVGLNVEAADLDGDGDLDLVTTGKWGGPILLENMLIKKSR